MNGHIAGVDKLYEICMKKEKSNELLIWLIDRMVHLSE